MVRQEGRARGIASGVGVCAPLRLRATPVRAVTGVADADGAMLPIERYAVDIDAAGDGWVRVRTTNAARMVVTLTAG